MGNCWRGTGFLPKIHNGNGAHQPSGQTLVEFALVLPVMAIMLLGVMAVGQFVFTLHDTSSKVRGLHKNSLRYASQSNVAQLIEDDLGEGYTVKIRGSADHAMVVQASRSYQPLGNLLPSVTITSSTSLPARMIGDPTGQPANTPPSFADDPAQAIGLAQNENLSEPANCPEAGFCLGTEYGQASPAEFFHIGGGTVNLPSGIDITEAANCTSVSLANLTANTFTIDDTDLPIHPQCPADDEDCINGKTANAMAYVQHHLDLLTNNGGCDGEVLR